MKNWKTTVIGLVLAGLTAWQGCTSHDPKTIAGAVLIAIFGVLAKDYNVSSPAPTEGQKANQP